MLLRCVNSVTLARSDVFSYLSVICDELDKPRMGEEDDKLEDLKENETDTTERRKIRGEICSSALL